MKASTLLHKNPLYNATEYTMTSYLSAYLGNENFKRACRKKRPSEDAVIYTDLIQHTTVMPVCRYVVDTINDVVFEPGINRQPLFASETGTLLPIDQQDWSELFLLDADLTNTSLDGVMENIGDLSSIFGFCWVFVDMPEVQPGYESSTRPYVVPVSPLNVWDWEFKSIRGVLIPEYVKVLERETPEAYYFKCYYLGTKSVPSYWECYEVEKNGVADAEVMVEATGQFPLGMSIPGFIAYTKRDPRRFELGISDIDIATDVQKEIYKLETEAYSSIQFARTLIRADEGVIIGAQAGTIVRATQGQVESINVDQQDVNTIVAKQQDLLINFQNMSGLGGLTTSSSKIQSGIAIIEERRQLHRIAKAKSRLMEIAEEQIWTFASRFMGVRWAGEVKYNTDYEQGDTAYRIALMEKAKQLIPENPIINGLIVEQMVRLLSKPEEVEEVLEAAKIASTDAIILEHEAGEVYSRDVGDQVPNDEPGEAGGDSKEDMEEHGTGDSSNTIINTGRSFNTADAVATQLGFGFAGGR
jgi:hypothetical protein